jgi:hypothetical protein
MTTAPLPRPKGSYEDDAGFARRGTANLAEWEAYARDQQDRAELPARVALGLIGGGAGFAERGALGAAGGRLARESALPMDEASRMARADAMGFHRSMPLYHGSNTEFTGFRSVPTTQAEQAAPGVSTALNPAVAQEFAESRTTTHGGQPKVYPLLHRAERPAVLDLTGQESHHEVVATLRDAFDRGHDAVMLRNYTTPGGIPNQKIVIVRDANQLRSPDAAFDPARRGNSNLLAGIAGASAVPAMTYSELFPGDGN